MSLYKTETPYSLPGSWNGMREVKEVKGRNELEEEENDVGKSASA